MRGWTDDGFHGRVPPPTDAGADVRVHFTPDTCDGITMPRRHSAEIPFPAQRLEVKRGDATVYFVRRQRTFTKNGETFRWWDIEPEEWAKAQDR